MALCGRPKNRDIPEADLYTAETYRERRERKVRLADEDRNPFARERQLEDVRRQIVRNRNPKALQMTTADRQPPKRILRSQSTTAEASDMPIFKPYAEQIEKSRSFSTLDFVTGSHRPWSIPLPKRDGLKKLKPPKHRVGLRVGELRKLLTTEDRSLMTPPQQQQQQPRPRRLRRQEEEEEDFSEAEASWNAAFFGAAASAEARYRERIGMRPAIVGVRREPPEPRKRTSRHVDETLREREHKREGR